MRKFNASKGERRLISNNLPTLAPRAARHRDTLSKYRKLFNFCANRLPHMQWNWRRWRKIACDKRLVSTVNFIVIVLLFWQVASILRLKGDSNIIMKVWSNKKSEDLPYPLNFAKLAMEPGASVHLPIASINGSERKQWPGYAGIRAATFRNKYPSTSITGTGTFDSIYVITNGRCEQQWEIFQKVANNFSLSYMKWPQLDARHVSLSDPPFPLSTAASQQATGKNRALLSILKRQIAYLDAHHRIWKHIVETGKQRVLVTDDNLFPTIRLLRSLPAAMTNIDQESVARQTPWHFIFLRRQVQGVQNKRLVSRRKEEMWTMNPRYKHTVVIANVSHGVGSYVISLDGAKFLLRHLTQYRVPLDVEIGLLQKEHGAKFVALSACNNDELDPFCPEMIRDISLAGWSGSFDCAWRRVQETQTASGFDMTLNNVQS